MTPNRSPSCRTGRGPGRPRDFDLDEALERAMHLFWRDGYNGTSVSDLTEAIGINRASLYAAFGSKEALFAKVLDRYGEGPSFYQREALEESTAYGVVRRILHGVIDAVCNRKNPRGCLWVRGLLSSGGVAESVQRDLIARRKIDEARLLKRFRRAVKEGDLPPGCDPRGLTEYVSALNFGLAVQAAAGATRSELQRVAEAALRSWPP